MFLANRWHVERPWHEIGLGIFQKLQIVDCDFAEYMQVLWGLQKRQVGSRTRKDLGAIIAMPMKLHFILQNQGYISQPCPQTHLPSGSHLQYHVPRCSTNMLHCQPPTWIYFPTSALMHVVFLYLNFMLSFLQNSHLNRDFLPEATSAPGSSVTSSRQFRAEKNLWDYLVLNLHFTDTTEAKRDQVTCAHFYSQ